MVKPYIAIFDKVQYKKCRYINIKYFTRFYNVAKKKAELYLISVNLELIKFIKKKMRL